MEENGAKHMQAWMSNLWVVNLRHAKKLAKEKFSQIVNKNLLGFHFDQLFGALGEEIGDVPDHVDREIRNVVILLISRKLLDYLQYLLYTGKIKVYQVVVDDKLDALESL